MEKEKTNPSLNVKEWLGLPGCKEDAYVIARVTADEYDGNAMFKLSDGQNTVSFGTGLYADEHVEAAIAAAYRLQEILLQLARALEQSRLRTAQLNERHWKTRATSAGASTPLEKSLDEIFRSEDESAPQAANRTVEAPDHPGN